jgi:hypothetical protein
VFSLCFVTTGPDDCFVGATRLPPSLDLPLESLDEDLESCLQHVSFVLPSYFYVIVLPLIGHFHRHSHYWRNDVKKGPLNRHSWPRWRS